MRGFAEECPEPPDENNVVNCAVLLASYNGCRFLPEQVRSISSQSHAHIDLYISDDGSTDGSADFFRAEQARWDKGAFVVLQGPKLGQAAENFRSLILTPDLDADYVAFSDQDDVWMPGKLEAAIARLEGLPHDVPAMHCSRTRLIDEQGADAGLSHYFPHAPHFRNALVQSLAGANTMVINRAGFALLRKTAAHGSFAMHDWWAYIIISGAGGTIIYSDTPDTLYRQHKGNVFGSNQGILAMAARLKMLFSGRFRNWNEKNLALLMACRDDLLPEHIACLTAFAAAHQGSLPLRLVNLWRSKVFRQTPGGQIMLYVACAMGRL